MIQRESSIGSAAVEACARQLVANGPCGDVTAVAPCQTSAPGSVLELVQLGVLLSPLPGSLDLTIPMGQVPGPHAGASSLAVAAVALASSQQPSLTDRHLVAVP